VGEKQNQCYQLSVKSSLKVGSVMLFDLDPEDLELIRVLKARFPTLVRGALNYGL
jgi:hypothetical protein